MMQCYQNPLNIFFISLKAILGINTHVSAMKVGKQSVIRSMHSVIVMVVTLGAKISTNVLVELTAVLKHVLIMMVAMTVAVPPQVMKSKKMA